MKKIISLYQRNYDGDRLVRDEVVAGAEWVLAGEGTPTRKWDGTCCLVRDGQLYRRYDAKPGRTPPPDFEPAQDFDPITGHQTGWIAVKDIPADKWYRAAWATAGAWLPDGTYELCGPHFQTNPESFPFDTFIPHGRDVLPDIERTYASIRDFLEGAGIEGIVWHHPDGRMVKIKTRDFGLKRLAKDIPL